MILSGSPVTLGCSPRFEPPHPGLLGLGFEPINHHLVLLGLGFGLGYRLKYLEYHFLERLLNGFLLTFFVVVAYITESETRK